MTLLQEQWKFVQSLCLLPEQTKRVDCPFCGGLKTFTATKHAGFSVWNCFKASCIAKGCSKTDLSLRDIQKLLITVDTKTQTLLTIPAHWVTITSQKTPEAYNYLVKNHCYNAFEKGIVNIRYDVKENRVVFLIYDNKKLTDAVGRLILNDKSKQKWYRYARTGLAFLTQNKSHLGIVVEDAASACAVSHFGIGVALLGSTMSQTHYEQILKANFSTIIVALDPDATKKAFDIQRILDYHVRTRIAFISDDLKYYNEEEVVNILSPYLKGD